MNSGSESLAGDEAQVRVRVLLRLVLCQRFEPHYVYYLAFDPHLSIVSTAL